MGRHHAVVIGASIAGMCAARVLAEHYDRVTVFERDPLPDEAADRAAVPQGKHVHLLMARGAAEFEGLFPGLLDDMVAAGVPMLENRPDRISFGAAGHLLGTSHRLQDEFTAYVPSRAHLEWQIRRRALAIPGVTLRAAGVDEPILEGGRVTGVRVDGEGPVAADVVVDATGRGTRLPAWLDQWGYGRPREDTVEVGIGYASQRVTIPDGLLEEKVVVAGASRTQPLGLGMLLYEDGVWNVTTFGTGKAAPPRDFAGMRALAEEIVPAHVAAALHRATPVGEPAFHKYPTSRWRRFDKMDRWPAGIIPFGDAVVSYNPTFGQGMTMTSLQARNLRTVLDGGTGDDALPAALMKATAKTTFPVWTMTAIGDITMHNGSGESKWWYRPVGSLFEQFLGAAETDPVLAEWFLRRFSLLDSLYMVPPPRIVGRAIRHNSRLWLAERRATKREPAVAQPR